MHGLYAGWPTGCFCTRDSLTVGESGSSGVMRSLRWRIPPFSSLDKRSRVALHFPVNIRLEKERAMFELAFIGPFFWQPLLYGSAFSHQFVQITVRQQPQPSLEKSDVLFSLVCSTWLLQEQYWKHYGSL